MKTPKFWSKNNLISLLLSPLGWIYAFGTKLRLSLIPSRKVEIPVICVGNLTAGGTGKTPVAISLAKLMQDKGKMPVFISRGYGGQIQDVLVIKIANNIAFSAEEVGDEPILLAEQAPVIVNSNRYKAAEKAIDNNADMIIMDDGFQNPSLHKDLSFILIDENYGFGNGKCIPAGPLRETVKSGSKRADAILLISSPSMREGRKPSIGNLNLPIFKGAINPIKPPRNFKENIVAFAGIGNPRKFYDSLRKTGFHILKTIDFADHHKYKEKELREIIKTAQKLDADIFTTSKDFVKIPKSLRQNFNVLNIEIQWEDEEKLTRFILDKIKNHE